MGLPIEHLATFLCLLLVASLCDLEARRIPNVVSVALVCSGLGAQLVNGGLPGLAQGLAAALAVLAVTWFPWRRGWLGGGDVKVAVGAASWLGLADLPTFILAAALVGGPLALLTWGLAPAAARARVALSLRWILVTRAAPEGVAGEALVPVPYAVAVSVGALAAILVPR